MTPFPPPWRGCQRFPSTPSRPAAEAQEGRGGVDQGRARGDRQRRRSGEDFRRGGREERLERELQMELKAEDTMAGGWGGNREDWDICGEWL